MTVFPVNRARVTQARDGTLWLAITDYRLLITDY